MTASTETTREQSGFTIYRRLVGYSMEYRYRIIVLFALSVVVAGAFTSMIYSVGTMIRILYDDPAKIEEELEDLRDSARTIATHLEPVAGWDPQTVADTVVARVQSMRDDRGYAVRVLAITLIALSALGGICRYFQEYFASSIGVRVATRLNQQMFDNLLTMSHRFFEHRQSGDLLARFANDAFAVNRGLVTVLVKLFREPIKIVLFVGLAFSIDMWLSMMVLFVLSPIVFLVISVGRYVRVNVRRNLTRLGLLTSAVNEMIRGFVVVKAFGTEDTQSERFSRVLHRVRKTLLRLARADSAITPASEFMLIIGLAVFMVFAEERVLSGSLSAGELVILFASLAALLDPLRKLAKANNQIQTSIASAARVFSVIDEQPDIRDAPDAVELPAMQDALRFESVSFGYTPDEPVLHDVSLTLKRGEMVALVGLSGAGKTTIAKLIPRFYDPMDGRITLDGTDIRNATLRSLRGQIGVVTQENVLFNDTIRHNIAFDEEQFSEQDVRAAAKAAHIDEFIESLPGQYQYEISEGGANLSGGQRQRIAIARAVIRDPAILILDEATSSLDSESEQAIRQAIDEFVVGRATIVIAHRLSTIQRADRILVIDAGRIVEEGTHTSLMEKGGVYKRLYALQFADEDIRATRQSAG